jgi:ferredoxin
MLAGGIGITLPLALLRELARLDRQGRRVPRTTLLLSFSRIADIPFLHELLQLSLTTSWFGLRIHITREGISANGLFVPGRPSQEALRALGPPQAVVICGSHGFAQAFREHARTCFPRAVQHIEAFTPPAGAAATPTSSAQVRQTQASQQIQLQILHSGQIVPAQAGKSLLEILEGAGVAIRSQCRAGICGSCRVRMTGGCSRMEADFCLSDKDKGAGYALACCTFPTAGHISIDLKHGA